MPRSVRSRSSPSVSSYVALLQEDRGAALGVDERLPQRAVTRGRVAGAVVAVERGGDDWRRTSFDGTHVARLERRPCEAALVGSRAVRRGGFVDRLAADIEGVRVGRPAMVLERQQRGVRVLEIAIGIERAGRVVREVVALLDDPDLASTRLRRICREDRVPHRHAACGLLRLVQARRPPSRRSARSSRARSRTSPPCRCRRPARAAGRHPGRAVLPLTVALTSTASPPASTWMPPPRPPGSEPSPAKLKLTVESLTRSAPAVEMPPPPESAWLLLTIARLSTSAAAAETRMPPPSLSSST